MPDSEETLPRDRQALVEKLLDSLQATPNPLEYLGKAPDRAELFDPYQMVSEWIALRHEVKQQNKLSQAAHASLQQALETERLQNAQLQQRLEELSNTKSDNQSYHSEQKRLFQDLLKMMDALDQACEYGRSQISASMPTPPASTNFLEKLFSRPKADSRDFNKGLLSHQQGVEVIRRSLLDLLKQKQVVPIVTLGKPFDPAYMYAIGRQESDTAPENTVIQEIVRGYWWQDQVLREAQVMVAVSKE